MKRFVRVYLTMFAIAMLVTNLVLVLVYGKQFLLNALVVDPVQGTAVNQVIFLINGVVIIIFAIFWAIANYYYRQSKQALSAENSKEW